MIVLGVHILVVLETNTVLNGLWNLTQNIKDSCKELLQKLIADKVFIFIHAIR